MTESDVLDQKALASARRYMTAVAWPTVVLGLVVFVVIRRECSVDQSNRHHVFDAVVTVGGIVERTGLVDDADARFLRLDDNLVDVVEAEEGDAIFGFVTRTLVIFGDFFGQGSVYVGFGGHGNQSASP